MNIGVLTEKAIQKARETIESTYSGVLTTIEYRDVKDESTKVTKKKEVPVLENEPCRLSFKSSKAIGLQDGAGVKAQDVKVFLAPEKGVLPGTKVIITQDGTTTAYKSSGVPSMYATHQEITLELFERWS